MVIHQVCFSVRVPGKSRAYAGKTRKEGTAWRCAGTRKSTRGKWCKVTGCGVYQLVVRRRSPGSKRLDQSAVRIDHDNQKLLCVAILCSEWHSSSSFVKSRKRLGVARGSAEQTQVVRPALRIHCSRTHFPGGVPLSSSGRRSSNIRILRKGSQSQNPFVPQSVAWIADRSAPVGRYC